MGRPRKECFCGRRIARRYAHGNTKATVPHKCPHGRWCEAGTLNGHHANWPTCPYCRTAYHAAGRCPECGDSECGPGCPSRHWSRKPTV